VFGNRLQSPSFRFRTSLAAWRRQGKPGRVEDVPSYEPIRAVVAPGEAVRVFPLQDGAEFLRLRKEHDIPLKPDDQFEFAFDIAFNEPGIVQGGPVAEVLHQLLGLVTNITDTLSELRSLLVPKAMAPH
jgi:hypothetical protein